MTTEELTWLGNIATKCASIAEIGCWKGRTTTALLSHCPGIVYAVDHWRGSIAELNGPHREARERDIYAEFCSNTTGHNNLFIRRGESTEIAERLPIVDMVFIDGGHTYEEVRADITSWTPKALCMIAGHDWDIPDVKRAVTEVFGERVKRGAGSIWYVPTPNQYSIMLATPSYDGKVHVNYVSSVMKAERAARAKHIGFEIRWQHGDSLVPRARISLLSHFLSSSYHTHLLFVDADLGWDPPESVLNLLRWNKSVVAGVYPKKSLQKSWPAVLCNPLVYDEETRCLQAEYVPTGFMMIKRSAIEAMIQAYPSRRVIVSESNDVINDNAFDFFPCVPETSSKMYLSEDFGFCDLWKALGGDIWIDPDISFEHCGAHAFTGNLNESIRG
jgi:hypothetical protein